MATTTGDTINGAFAKLDFSNLVYTTGATATYNTSTGVLTVTSGGFYESLTLNNPGTTTFPVSGDGNTGTAVTGANPSGSTININNQPTAVCFAQGTRIRTVRGEVSVETLAVGDLVVTSSGSERPIRWIGHRTIDCARHPQPAVVLPVRIAAHAFGAGRPSRDLFVSPGHALAVDVLGEVLIPASSLVNGTTIRSEQVERVTYWHVELDSHDLLMAENLAAESYCDMGNRRFFANGTAVGLYDGPDAPVPADHAAFCRPFHADGAVVAFVRERLAARARAMGWTRVEDPLAGMHLVADGRRIEPEVCGLSVRFIVPTTATELWLMSKAAVPLQVGAGADGRTLGICLAGFALGDGFGPERRVGVDDPCLSVGFHHVEAGPQRWTTGRAGLPTDLWAGMNAASFFLRVDLAHPALPRWEMAVSANEKAA